jgi:signal transduction histidine kinase
MKPTILWSYLRTLARGKRREMLGPVQLGLLGYLAWTFAAVVLLWNAWQQAGSQVLMVFLCMLGSGLISLALGLYLLFRFLLPPARWHRNNRDGVLWLGLLAGGACIVGIGVFHELSLVEHFFQSFLLLTYTPFLARFRSPVALATLLAEAAVMGSLAGGMSGLFLAGAFGLQGLVLLWLTNAVLEERHVREESELHVARLAGTRHLLGQAVAEAERARLARDLHDEMGHHLVALNLRLQLLERAASLSEGREHLEQARSLAGLLFSDLRNTVAGLREPSSLDLRAAIEALAAHLPGLEVALDMGLEQGALTMLEAECLLRCIQEAMTNALKHGQATRIRVALGEDEDGLLLEVRDNGRAANTPLQGGLGLRGLQERLQDIAGRLWTERDAAGFTLYAQIPRRENA